MRGTVEPSDSRDADDLRFSRSNRVYLETSAFNYLIDNVGLPKFELTRAYQRRKGVIFVTSPMLLWEIMLNSDRERADMMLMAAQALFDPILLGTPTELTIRYLRSAYPRNVVNYDIKSGLSWTGLWSRMTRDFGCSMTYDFNELLRKSKPIRDISRNLTSVIEDITHRNEVVDLARTFVAGVFHALSDSLQDWGLDDVIAKFVILYTFLLLLAGADLDGTAARDFWIEKGFTGELGRAEVTRVFLDYPEIFVRGPLLEMAIMAALQYQSGKTNRGAIYDGMHMVYAPHVSAILSNDRAFIGLAKAHPTYRTRVLHMSQVAITDVALDLDDYPDDQKLSKLD
jgi:hypothetical protein